MTSAPERPNHRQGQLTHRREWFVLPLIEINGKSYYGSHVFLDDKKRANSDAKLRKWAV